MIDVWPGRGSASQESLLKSQYTAGDALVLRVPVFEVVMGGVNLVGGHIMRGVM